MTIPLTSASVMPASSRVILVTSASSWNEPRPSSLPCSVSPTPAMTMPLPSIRRASRRLGVASLIHPPRRRLSDQPGPRPRTAAERRESTQGPNTRRVGPVRPGTLPVRERACVGTIRLVLRPRAPRRAACVLRPQLRRRERHLPPDLPRPRQRLRGHQHRGPDGLLRPGHQRRAGLLDRQLQGLLRGPPAPRTASSRCTLPAKVPATSRRRWTSTPRRSAPASASPSSTRPSPPGGRAADDDRVGPLARGDHREDLGHRVDVHVDQRRPVGREGLGERVVEVAGVVDGGRVDAVRPGDALEARLEAGRSSSPA